MNTQHKDWVKELQSRLEACHDAIERVAVAEDTKEIEGLRNGIKMALYGVSRQAEVLESLIKQQDAI